MHEPERGRSLPSAKPYLDAPGLEHHMHHTVDWLAAGLLDTAVAKHLSSISKRPGAPEKTSGGPSPPRNMFFEHTHAAKATEEALQEEAARKGTRVLPLYLFSLLHAHPELLLGKDGLQVHTSSDAIIVLQTNASAIPLPYTSDNQPVLADARDPTRHALAGLATAVGGLLPPYESLRYRSTESYPHRPTRSRASAAHIVTHTD